MARRVVVIGKNRLAVECLDVVIEAGDEVALAVADAGDDGTDGWQPSFRGAAERHGLPLAAPADVNDPAFVARIDAEEPDFVLSFQAAQILRRPLIATGRVATLNLHFGPLPRYRGVAPIAWAVINGEAATGVTIHRINPGIDSGEIVRSAAVPIDDADTGRTVYDKCTGAGIALFREAWPELRTGAIESHPQDPGAALYYNRHSIDFSRRRVSWHADARSIADWMRAFIFPPFQFPLIAVDGTEHEVAGVTWDRAPHRGRPGEILEVDGTRIVVGAPGGRLTLGPLRREGTDLDADGVAAGFSVGAVLEDA